MIHSFSRNLSLTAKYRQMQIVNVIIHFFSQKTQGCVTGLTVSLLEEDRQAQMLTVLALLAMEYWTS
jgi:hypothetical protein